MSDLTMPTSRRADAAAMWIAALFPTFAAWLYFMAMTGYPAGIQRATYGASKVLQFGFPIAWLLVTRRWPRWKWPTIGGLFESLLFGAVVSGVMLVAYFGWLRDAGYLAVAAQPVADKITGFGVNSLPRYVALGVFYCLIHSLLEEYYWRWFLFGGLDRLMRLWPAILLSSVAFVGHHIIILAALWLDIARHGVVLGLRGRRRRGVGLALFSKRFASWALAQPSAGRCRDLHHRIRSGAKRRRMVKAVSSHASRRASLARLGLGQFGLGGGKLFFKMLHLRHVVHLLAGASQLLPQILNPRVQNVNLLLLLLVHNSSSFGSDSRFYDCNNR